MTIIETNIYNWKKGITNKHEIKAINDAHHGSVLLLNNFTPAAIDIIETKIPRDVGINKISSNAKDKPFTIKTPATEKQIINNTILLGIWVVACSFERFLGKAPSLLNEYPNCVRLATNAFEVPVQMIKAKIAVTYLAPAPTASPIIIPIGDRLLSSLPYVPVPMVTKLNAKNSTPMITAL